MANFNASELRTLDPVLTALTQEYHNAAFVSEAIFPLVQVSKTSGRIPEFGKGNFVARETYRAEGARSNRIPQDGLRLIDFKTLERDVEIAIDYLEEERIDDIFKVEEKTARELSDILALGREKEAAELAMNIANYPSGSVITLDADSAFDGSNPDPLGIIRTAMEKIRLRIGRYPNTAIIGNAVFKSIVNNFSLNERYKFSGNLVITPEALSELVGIDKVFIGLSVYSDDGTTFTDIWGDNIILAYVDANEKSKRSEYNPSFGYTLQKNGMPEIDSYYENGGKTKVIRNTDNYCIKIVSPDAGALIRNCLVNL